MKAWMMQWRFLLVWAVKEIRTPLPALSIMQLTLYLNFSRMLYHFRKKYSYDHLIRSQLDLYQSIMSAKSKWKYYTLNHQPDGVGKKLEFLLKAGSLSLWAMRSILQPIMIRWFYLDPKVMALPLMGQILEKKHFLHSWVWWGPFHALTLILWAVTQVQITG